MARDPSVMWWILLAGKGNKGQLGLALAGEEK
jgi:hypothetical protein